MGQLIFNGSGGGGIPSSDLLATHENVLSTKSYVGVDTNDDPAVGTMQDNSLMTKNGDDGVEAVSITASEKSIPTRTGKNVRFANDAKGTTRVNVSVPRGYYPDNSSYVSFTSDKLGNATADQVLSGVSFSSKNYFGMNANAKGTMPNRGAWGTTLNLTNNNTAEVTVPKGYHNGSGKVYAKIDLTRQPGITDGRSIRATGNKILVEIPHGIYHINSNGHGNPEIALSKLEIYRKIGVAGISDLSITKSGSRSARIKFTKPTSGAWTGLLVTGKADGYPNSPGDGEVVKDFKTDGYQYADLPRRANWFWRSWVYWDTDNGRVYGTHYDSGSFTGGYSCSCNSNCGDCGDCGDSCSDRSPSCGCNNAHAWCNTL